jgi:hypothetical protein
MKSVLRFLPKRIENLPNRGRLPRTRPRRAVCQTRHQTRLHIQSLTLERLDRARVNQRLVHANQTQTQNQTLLHPKGW